MKKITKHFLFTSLSILALTFTGCSNDNNTGKSTLEVVKGITGSVTLNPGLAVTQIVNEPRNFRDATLNETLKYSYTVNIDKPQSVDIHVTVVQVSGSAKDGSDFKFDNNLVIPAFQTSVEGTVTILSDATVEADEDFKLQIGTASTSNASVTSSTVSFLIKNYLSHDLEFTFDYNQPLSIYGDSSAGETLYNKPLYFLHYIVLDEAGNDVGLDEANPNVLRYGSKKLIISDDSASASYLPDGNYYVNYVVVFNDFPANTEYSSMKVPTTVTYLRRGGIEMNTFNQEIDFIPTTNDLERQDFVISFSKLNGIYTIGNSLSVPIVSGRLANGINDIKLKSKTAKVSFAR